MAEETELEQRVRERAFQIWIEEGQPLGRDKEHWERAHREMTGDNGPPRQASEPIGQVHYAGLVDRGEGQAPADDGE
jgi:hypothetical protein